MKLSRQTFIENLAKHWPHLRNETLLLALSGGVDSMVMAHLFHDAGFSIGVAHVNYHLRGRDSDFDQQIVEDFAGNYNLPFFNFHAEEDLSTLKNGNSLQMQARNLRYHYFSNICRVFQFKYVATAHQLDDQAETLLLNMLRGMGYLGFDGINEHTGNIIRPMLPFTRLEIEKYAAAENIPFRHDKSNFSDKYERNFLRNQVLPLLNDRFKGASENLASFASHWQQYGKIVHEVIENERAKLIFKNGKWYYPMVELKGRDNAQTLIYELLRPFHFNADDAASVFRTLMQSKSGVWIENKQGFRTGLAGKSLIIEKIDSPVETAEIVILPNKKWLKTPFGKFKISQGSKMAKDHHVQAFYCPQWTFPLMLRKWKAGDRFKPSGMKGSKKVSDFLTALKLSKGEKEKVWVLCHGNEIIWVNGLRISEEYRKQENAEKIEILWEKPGN